MTRNRPKLNRIILKLHQAAANSSYLPQDDEVATSKKEPVRCPAASGPKKARLTREIPVRNKVLPGLKIFSSIMLNADWWWISPKRVQLRAVGR